MTHARALQVVHFLVSHGYLLSALELLVEAERAEIESDISVGQLLGPFFNNPDNFPAEELAKCSGDDGAREGTRAHHPPTHPPTRICNHSPAADAAAWCSLITTPGRVHFGSATG